MEVEQGEVDGLSRGYFQDVGGVGQPAPRLFCHQGGDGRAARGRLEAFGGAADGPCRGDHCGGREGERVRVKSLLLSHSYLYNKY